MNTNAMAIRRVLVQALSVALCGLTLWGCAQLSLLEALLPSQSSLLPADGSVPYINIQIDAEREDTVGITRLTEALRTRGIPATVYVTADYANQQALLVHDFYTQGFEIALHGYYTGEQLASMTYDEQKDLLSRALTALSGCAPCGTSQPVIGFRPQYFSQNEDTYRVLDELGLTYDCGFKAGQIYLTGHEQDVTPYAAEGHQFHAVPLTTLEHNGEGIYLCDIACALVEEMTADEWSTVLSAGLQQSVDQQQPLVVLFHGWYTGDTEQYDYWQPFVDFLDDATTQGAFVTTQQLVELAGE